MREENDKKRLGAYGETLAAEFLLRHGFEIIARNFRVRGAELDIIAFKNNALYFVEVKTRKNLRYGTPEEAIHYYKQRHMRFASQIFIAKNPRFAECEMHNSSIAVEVDFLSSRAKIRFIMDVF